MFHTVGDVKSIISVQVCKQICRVKIIFRKKLIMKTQLNELHIYQQNSQGCFTLCFSLKLTH